MKFKRIIAATLAALIAVSVSACAPSAKSVFKTEAQAWFESFDSEQTAKSESVINYSEDGAVAYEYPLTGDEATDSEILAIYNMYIQTSAPVTGEKLMLSYKLHNPCDGVYGMEFISKKISAGGGVEEGIRYYNFVKDSAKGCEVPEILQKMAVVEAISRADGELNKDACVFLYKAESILVTDSDSSVEVPYTYVRPYLPDIMKDSVPIDESVRVIDVTKKMVALTYDDGPHGVYTKKLLDILEEHGGVATFYEVGVNLGIAPEQVKRADEMGCELGSHSWSHANLETSAPDKIRSQLEDTNEKFKEILGYAPATVRPPYGAVGKNLKQISTQPLIGWSVDTLDWKSRDKDKVIASVKNKKDLDGDVILMHSLYQSTVDATKVLVPWLIENGYQLVTVSELMKYRYEVAPEAGEFYSYNYFNNEPK